MLNTVRRGFPALQTERLGRLGSFNGRLIRCGGLRRFSSSEKFSLDFSGPIKISMEDGASWTSRLRNFVEHPLTKLTVTVVGIGAGVWKIGEITTATKESNALKNTLASAYTDVSTMVEISENSDQFTREAVINELINFVNSDSSREVDYFKALLSEEALVKVLPNTFLENGLTVGNKGGKINTAKIVCQITRKKGVRLLREDTDKHSPDLHKRIAAELVNQVNIFTTKAGTRKKYDADSFFGIWLLTELAYAIRLSKYARRKLRENLSLEKLERSLNEIGSKNPEELNHVYERLVFILSDRDTRDEKWNGQTCEFSGWGSSEMPLRLQEHYVKLQNAHFGPR